MSVNDKLLCRHLQFIAKMLIRTNGGYDARMFFYYHLMCTVYECSFNINTFPTEDDNQITSPIAHKKDYNATGFIVAST